MSETFKLHVGEWVEVRSKEEILKTLDANGRLDGMPFMPEMFAYCGQRFPVFKSAHKGCDTVFPIRSRRITNAVHLDTRCSGESHGGCQAACLLYWKNAWLKPVDGDAMNSAVPVDAAVAHPKNAGCSEEDVNRATRSSGGSGGEAPIYACQATELPAASEDLNPYDFRQYIEDYTSGNVSAGRWIVGAAYISYQRLINTGIGLGAPLRWLYERFQKLRGGLPYPQRRGTIPIGQQTPTARLGLQAGEWVRVKSYEDILATCGTDNRNRGMVWDGELMPYCGGTYRVLKRVSAIIDERTGKMLNMQNPCIILEGVVCQARYSECRMFCPRSIYPYWREIWLERVDPQHAAELDRQHSERSRASIPVLPIQRATGGGSRPSSAGAA
jgi:hypothetical protein